METERERRAAVAVPITKTVAKRVRELRESANLSGGALARRLADHGLKKWNRTTVAKFEASYRASITVQELLALALALNVPPVWLLVDPDADTVPVADGIEADPWSALRWIVGANQLPGQRESIEWQRAAMAVHSLRTVAALVARLEGGRDWEPVLLGPDFTPEQEVEQHDRAERLYLRQICGELRGFIEWGLPPPVLPRYVHERAKELGVDLDVEG